MLASKITGIPGKQKKFLFFLILPDGAPEDEQRPLSNYIYYLVNYLSYVNILIAGLIPSFKLIFRCGKFKIAHSFLFINLCGTCACPPSKFARQEIRSNYGILYSACNFELVILEKQTDFRDLGLLVLVRSPAKKMKFFIKNSFSESDKIRSFLWI